MTAKEELKQLLNQRLIAGQVASKWMPRKGKIAEEFRAYLGFSPKRYRKTLVTLSVSCERQMCAKDWDNINFGHVPSVAAARYKKAFKRNAEEAYTAYGEALSKGEAKINAGAVYPYDVLKGAFQSYERPTLSLTEKQVMLAQWDTLPNYVGDAAILPMVDVSGSMDCPVGGASKSSGVSCMDVAVSLGLYLAEKNTGAFKDTFMTFTDVPKIMNLKGDVLQKMGQMTGAVGYSTNLEAAIKRVLEVAISGNVPAAEMPKFLLILSDMQFNQCMKNPTEGAQAMIAAQYAAAGYELPAVVYWNLSAQDNVPVRFDAVGTALISGFSPAIMKSVLKAENFTPVSIMLGAVMVPRYALTV